MLISSCDSCGLNKEFRNSADRDCYGWKSVDNVVTCVNCRIKALEDALRNK